MHDFNEILLKLPINIVVAQHMEGGPEASLYFDLKGTKIELIGSFESFNENDGNVKFWAIPNVIGVEER